MSNWCVCDFTAAGPKADIEKLIAERFEEYKGTNVLEFNKVIPYPKEYKDMDDKVTAMRKAKVVPWDQIPKDGYNSGGYEWCCDNWGTKWGPCEPGDLLKDNLKKGTKISQRFDTAWAPPLPILDKLSDMYPTIRFGIKYYEGGMGFKGNYAVKGGKTIVNTRGDYRGRLGG